MLEAIANFFDAHPWVLIAILAHGIVLGTVAYLILLERKVASWVQDRLGPNRVGLGFGIIPWLKDKKMFGLGQPLADGLKFIVKEDYRPGDTDKILFSLAPGFMILVVIISIAVLPWGGIKQSTRTIDASKAVAKAAMVSPSELTPDIAHQAAVAGTPENRAVVAVAWDAVPAAGDLVGEPSVNITDREADLGHAATPGPARVTTTLTYRYPFQIANLNIGVLFILAVLALAVYGIVIGGWASNNKYSFLGGMRATAQMISYEIPLGLCVLCIVLMFGTLDLGAIVDKQAGYWMGFIPAWNVFAQPLTFLMFLVCIHAEANRAPFDLAEAEQELVGGYHTEYSAMRFALFFLAEYAGMITTSAVCVALFFGGWHLPWIEWAWPALRGNVEIGNHAVTTSLLACVVRSLIYFGKTLGIIFVFMWVRWSLPRFRFDQLMSIAWRAMIPISLALVMVTALVVYFMGGAGSRAYMRIGGRMALVMLGANVVILVAAMILSRVLPAPPQTNRRMKIAGSRFDKTPLPASAARTVPMASVSAV